MGVQRTVITEPFDQATNTTTDWVKVPDWARSVLVSLPALTSCTFTCLVSLDGGTTTSKRDYDLDGLANPRTSFVGGDGTDEELLWYEVEGMTHVKLKSSVAQTGISARLWFKE